MPPRPKPRAKPPIKKPQKGRKGVKKGLPVGSLGWGEAKLARLKQRQKDRLEWRINRWGNNRLK
jgi:hypothetical protein